MIMTMGTIMGITTAIITIDALGVAAASTSVDISVRRFA